MTQQPYISIGRKDGVVAELIESSDPNQSVGIVLYLQNTGHLPARKTCVLTRTFASPVIPTPFDYGDVLLRQRGKDSAGRLQSAESGCPTIGGDSAYAFFIKPFNQKSLDQIRTTKQIEFRINEVK